MYLKAHSVFGWNIVYFFLVINLAEKFRNFSTDLGLHHLNFASLLQIFFPIFQARRPIFFSQTPLERCHEGVFFFFFSFVRPGDSFSKEPRILGSWNKVKYNIRMIGIFLLFKWEGDAYKVGMWKCSAGGKKKKQSAEQLCPGANP